MTGRRILLGVLRIRGPEAPEMMQRDRNRPGTQAVHGRNETGLLFRREAVSGTDTAGAGPTAQPPESTYRATPGKE